MGEAGRRLGDRFREHLPDVEEDDKNASKPKKGRFSIPGSGIASDWSILTGFVNTRALLTQMRLVCWQPVFL